jgi:hypothetical protein
LTEQRVKVLLRRLDGMSFEEVGTVVAVHGRLVTVDGIAEPFEIGKSFNVVPAGGILHINRVAHDRLGEVLQHDPQAVVAQLLSESGKLSARAIKQRILELGFDSSEVDKAWTKAKKQLLSMPQVSTKGSSRQPEYAWEGSSPKPTLADMVGVSVSPTSSVGSVADAPRPSRAASDNDTDTADYKSAAIDDHELSPPLTTGSEAAADAARPSAEPEPDDPRSVLTAIRALEPGIDLPSVPALRKGLLATARELRKHDDSTLQGLLDNTAGRARRLAAAVLVSLPRKSPLGDNAAGVLDVDTTQQLVIGALDEIARTPASRRRWLGEAAGYLIERTLLRSSEAETPTTTLVQILVATPSFGLKSSRLLEAVADRLARELRREPSPTASEVADWDLGGIARALAHLRYQRSGARSALVTALYRVLPSGLMAQERWWTNIRLQDLIDAGDGNLAPVLEDPEVSEEVVAPLVQRALRDASSRRSLGLLFAAPAPLAKHIEPDKFRRAFERAAIADSYASDWLGSLTDRSAVDRAEEEVREARTATRKAEERAAEAKARTIQVTTENDRLKAMVSRAHQASVAMSTGHERQIKLDLVRTLAVLALDVRQSQAAESDPALIRQVDYLTRREGLQTIQFAGDRVAFDPTRHDSLGVHLDPGSPVIVLRPGYTWSSEHEDLVLVKAQVANYSQGETR